MNSQITADALLNAGYRHYEHHGQGQFCEGLYQHRVRDNEGVTRYFINVYEWLFPDGIGPRFAPEAHLYRADLGLVVKVQPEPTTTVADVEAFVAEAYTALRCVPDPHNNDQE